MMGTMASGSSSAADDRLMTSPASPSSSFDVSAFALEQYDLYQNKIAKIVVEQWTSFAVGRRADRRYDESLARRTLDGLALNRSEGRTLHRLALVHHASVSYGKYVSGTFDSWRALAVSKRRLRYCYMSVLARRAIHYTRVAFGRWKRWTREEREGHIIAAFDAWAARAREASTEEEGAVEAFRLRRHRSTLLIWRDRARESQELREKQTQAEDLLLKSALRRWSRRARAKAREDSEGLKIRLAMASWRRSARAKVERRRRLAGLSIEWRRKRLHRIFSAWRAAWLEAKDWELQKRLATAHYVGMLAKVCLREWRKFCEVVAWVQVKEAHRTRSNMHSALREWRQLAFRANDLERRRRAVVSRLYFSRLLCCFQVLQIHGEAMRANVARVFEAYSIVESNGLRRSFEAWAREFLPLRRRKREAARMAADLCRTRLARLAFRSWVEVNEVRSLQRRAMDLVTSRQCSNAFRVWRQAYEGLKAKERMDEERGAELRGVIVGKVLSRILGAWRAHAHAKALRKLTVSMAILRSQQRILRDCFRKAWVPYLARRRLKRAKVAQCEAVKERSLLRASVACLRDNVSRCNAKRLALSRARRHRISRLLRSTLAGWAGWISECKRRRQDEARAIEKFRANCASTGIQKMMEAGLWRHRSRMRALAAVNAEETKRRLELVEPIARVWRQKARRSAEGVARRRQVASYVRQERFEGSDLSLLPEAAVVAAVDGGISINTAREHKELVESAKSALSRVSVLLESERRGSENLQEFIARKSRGRKQPRRGLLEAMG